MLSDKALRYLSEFILRKAPEGLYSVRTFCACSPFKRLDIKTVDEAVTILNDFFEKFSSLVDEKEIEMLKPWLKPYGIEIKLDNGRYKAELAKTGFEEKIEELLDYYCCGLKKQALILCRALMDEFAKNKGFNNFTELLESLNGESSKVLKQLYEITSKDLSDEEILFIIKILKPMFELLSWQSLSQRA